MNNNIFKDFGHQQKFDSDGFIVIDLMNEEQLDLFARLDIIKNIEPNSSFYSTSFSHNSELKKKLDQEINACVKTAVDNLLNEHQPLGTSLLVKESGEGGEMEPHQDWTIVDESRFESVTIWIPLEDVDERNGALSVVRGSHKLSSIIRSPFFKNSLSNILHQINADSELVRLKKGQAIVFNQALIHSSGLNRAEKPRLAITYGLIPKNAQLYFFTKEKEEIIQYAVPTNFFKTYNTRIGEIPSDGEVMNKLPFNPNKELITTTDYYNFKINYSKQMRSTQNDKKLFKETKYQDLFDQNGFLRLPLLDKKEIEDLTAYYHNLAIEDEKGFGFHVSMDSVGEDKGRVIRDYIWSIIVPKLNKHLVNYKPYVASYVVKEINPKGIVPAHQDWSFVDNEPEGFSSITCWIPLLDTSLENGCIGVINGSHHFFNNFRPSPSPQTPVPLSDHMFSVFPYLNTVQMKAGEVLLFDNRTFHASLPNTSSNVRLAVGVGITQLDSTLVHYYLKPDGLKNTLMKYKVDEDFFLKYNNARLSNMYTNNETIQDYEYLGEVPYQFDNLSSNELIEIIKSAGNEYNEPMCEKLKTLYGEDAINSFNNNNRNEAEAVSSVSIDSRTFLEKYTPKNIFNEIKYRLTGK